MFGLRAGGRGSGGLGLGFRGAQATGLRHFEFLEGAVVNAIAGIGDPLETLECAGIGGEGVAGSAGRGCVDIFYDEGVVGGLPELGFDAAHAAEAPFVVNEIVDEEALLGVGGCVQLVVFVSEFGEIFGFFVEHDLVNGEDGVLEGVESGYGLALGSARSGRFLCIHAVSCVLFRGCHNNLDSRLAGVIAAGWRRRNLKCVKMAGKRRKINLQVL